MGGGVQVDIGEKCLSAAGRGSYRGCTVPVMCYRRGLAYCPVTSGFAIIAYYLGRQACAEPLRNRVRNKPAPCYGVNPRCGVVMLCLCMDVMWKQRQMGASQGCLELFIFGSAGNSTEKLGTVTIRLPIWHCVKHRPQALAGQH